ncbi:glycosyltransferase family 4 protein [Pseudomonas sp.]|uniref:glycosyltransferase n=1 Tax=Pseudomonas sp. TaxID=306 RepID=UPI00262A8B63|nr:glycosyltransferase family 4 protein [Pseudomonas sp.]
MKPNLPSTPTRVLIIGYVWPEPRSSAAGGHMVQLIECFLQQGWQVTFSSPAAAGEHKADLGALGISEVGIELNNSSFDTFITELQPDIVLFDRFMMEEQFGWRVEKYCPNALRVLETVDLHSLREARQQTLKSHLKNAIAPDELADFFTQSEQAMFQPMASSDSAQREIAAIYRSDLSVMISDKEIDLLVSQFNVPSALLHWCPLLVETVPTTAPAFTERSHFLSIGNFRHAPNWDAVLWMKTAIWPLIRQQLPTAQLHIYGSYTPPKATALHNPAQGFHIMNWAEDALQVMSAARVCLAPLRFGAGIKGKLLDAMTCGTPSVTTPVGAEAMHGDLPWPGAIATSAQRIADAAVELYRNEAVWNNAQTEGWAVLANRYQFEPHCASLIATIEACRANLAQHRTNNFTGAMLRHHHHKSTQYMAQWIEAKNRG